MWLRSSNVWFCAWRPSKQAGRSPEKQVCPHRRRDLKNFGRSQLRPNDLNCRDGQSVPASRAESVAVQKCAATATSTLKRFASCPRMASRFRRSPTSLAAAGVTLPEWYERWAAQMRPVLLRCSCSKPNHHEGRTSVMHCCQTKVFTGAAISPSSSRSVFIARCAKPQPPRWDFFLRASRCGCRP